MISKAPKGDEALELFDAVCTVARTHTFAELKRSIRDPIDFADRPAVLDRPAGTPTAGRGVGAST